MSTLIVTHFKSMTPRRHAAPHGYAMLEMLVGAVLLVALIAFVAPLTVRSGWLWKDAQRARIALDELSNQLESLVEMDEQQAQAALGTLAPSPHAVQRLPHANLEGELVSDEDGTRFVLTLSWNRGERTKRSTLVGWLNSLPPTADSVDSTDDASSNTAAAAEEDAP